ncbi:MULTISPECIES: isochorismatase family protein [unclassified Pseudomonas]|jgi:nicotinamidase-related amidase|uniref:isochorismatase family protein n=1 Tax=unclassified Pseudomonas TaxID=196821 RepID=UPI0002701BF0|nr:isochorismatase family protein [Pseudomonas sp. GM30]EUB87735.1 isochorismatase hydrolase [Pseudomonas sp. GM30]
MTTQNGMLDPDDAVILLIDHQSGLFNTVRDVPIPDLRNYVIAIAKTATLLNIPVITTASVPDGPNGPLIPEIHQHAPHAVYVPRTGQINTWDNPLFVEAVEKTGRKTLIIAGTLTSVCMAFPAVSAVQAGYKAYCVVDASGNWSKLATDTTIARVVQAGAIPTDTFAIVAELMQTWNRAEGSRFAEILADHVCPEYKCLMESFGKAQAVVKEGAETHLDKYR